MPLQKNELLDKLHALNEKQAKSNIERIISSYRHTWDIFTELIQNSADAIIEEFGFENISSGKISLQIDNDKRIIKIYDNGCGIEETDLSSIFVTGESLKRKNGQGKYGFMGFGLTFIAFQTEFISIKSTHNGIKASRTYTDLYKFIYENALLNSSEEEINDIRAEVTDEQNGTEITLVFPKDFPDDGIESNLYTAFNYTKFVELFQTILRTRTAVGLLDTIFDSSVNFEFELIINEDKIIVENKFLTPREIINTVYPQEARVFDIDTYNKTIISISENFPEQQKESMRQAILLDSTIPSIQIGTRNKLNARVHVSSTSKNNLNRYNDSYLRRNEIDEENGYEYQNGIWLAINGLPTGVCLDSFEHGNYLPFTVIVDIQDKNFQKELDAGRKGITERRAWQIRETVKKILKDQKFIDYRKYILGSSTRIENQLYDPKQSLINKFNTKKEFDFGGILTYLPPCEEQEVISLFNLLLHNKIIKGYQEKVISSKEVYDGLYDYIIHETEENSIYSTSNYLGIDQGVFNQLGNKIEKKNLVIEYKQSLHQIFADIAIGLKNLNQIDILICWSINQKKVEETGSIISPKSIRNNIYYGVTHYLTHSQKSNLPVIELKTLLEKKFSVSINTIN